MEVFELKQAVVKDLVTKRTVGTYRLGVLNSGCFEIGYFGRSDKDLRRRLLEHTREASFTHFSFDISETLFEAFRKECRDWHLVKDSCKNCMHPGAPMRLPYLCPYCLAKKVFNFKRRLMNYGKRKDKTRIK